MGDGGVKYPTYTDELCEAMAALVDGADVLTPNLTAVSYTHLDLYKRQAPPRHPGTKNAPGAEAPRADKSHVGTRLLAVSLFPATVLGLRCV